MTQDIIVETSPPKSARPQLTRSILFTAKDPPEKRVHEEGLQCDRNEMERFKKPHHLNRSVALIVEVELAVVTADKQHEGIPFGLCSNCCVDSHTLPQTRKLHQTREIRTRYLDTTCIIVT
ncbi:hypothetical protein AC1031_006464 [Aphanomyces cochlioides]|nr:hypothetical protein AC1031_006464 [Aphanomyces cochlioides]